jgi:nucleoside-diphosphate-sugar epimerase
LADKTVLVTGASGLVGTGVLKAFQGLAGVKVIAVSRRPPIDTYGAEWISADLTDSAVCDALFSRMHDVTHLVFAALYEKAGLMAGWTEIDQIDTNDLMLQNTFEPLRKVAKGLQQVILLQGTKAYGAHVHAMPVPARPNRDEDKSIPNFYWRQQSYLENLSKNGCWKLTIIRPQIIFGLAVGAAMNPISAIGVYGALLKEKGEPLYFPGGLGDTAIEGAESGLVGRAIKWATEEPAAQGQVYNITNGDVLVWRQVWPAIAVALGMASGPDRPTSLADMLSQNEGSWAAIRRKYDLVAPDVAALVGESAHYADMLMSLGTSNPPRLPIIVSTINLRRDGFYDVMDSEDMFSSALREFQDRRLLPPA